jgi:hypothetical protein
MAYGQGNKSVSRRYAFGKTARYSGSFPSGMRGNFLLMLSGITLGVVLFGNPIVILCLPVILVVAVLYYTL